MSTRKMYLNINIVILATNGRPNVVPIAGLGVCEGWKGKGQHVNPKGFIQIEE